MHAGGLGDIAAGAIDGAVGEHVGDIDGVFSSVGDDADAAGQRQFARYYLPRRAGLGIDLLDAIVGHVGDEDAILGVDREVIGDGLSCATSSSRRLDRPHQLAGRGHQIAPESN